MYLVNSPDETSNSLELIILICKYRRGDALESMAEEQLQSRLSDLFAEIELELIVCASACKPSNDNCHLAASVMRGATSSIIDANRRYFRLPPLLF